MRKKMRKMRKNANRIFPPPCMHVAPTVRLRVQERGEFPFVRVPAAEAREESAASPPPLSSFCWRSPKAHGAPGILSELPQAVLGRPLLVSVLLWR